MFCEKCGKELAKNTKFCPGCGVNLAQEETISDSPTVAEPEVKTEIPQPVAKPVSPPQKYDNRSNLIKPLSTASYVGMFILLSIPIINIIMVLVWSFGSKANINKRNFGVAVLIMALISIILVIAFWILTLTLGAGFYKTLY